MHKTLAPFLVSFTYKAISKHAHVHVHTLTHKTAYTVPEPNSTSILDKIRPKFIVNVSPEMLHYNYQKLTLKVPTDYTPLSI